MTKALLTNINSVWGVIVNPQSSNTYRHVISFKDEAMKKAYVSQELLKGKDLDTELDKQPDISLTMKTAALAEFRVNISNYPDEDIMSLLNKDFAIIKHNGKYLYYTLQGTRQGNIIQYTADLDIFFTYDIKDMFNDKDAKISQAMSNS